MLGRDELRQFALRYTAAWCSHDAASVAGFFTPDGTLTINEGVRSTGRSSIRAAAQGFMTAFPDLVVLMDTLVVEETRAVYHWTLLGTNAGPDGTGNSVRISGYEEWQMSEECLIAESKGHFDETEYRNQLKNGSQC